MAESAASLEEWSDLYAAAAAFRRLEPWQWMLDDDVFGVQDPAGGQIGYCCVMGGLGQFVGFAVYPGSAALATIQGFRSGGADAMEDDAMFMQDCLVASFGERRDQDPRDLATIKALGLKFRGAGNWPLFRRHEPGYFPWFLTGDEVRFLTLALAQSVEVAQRLAHNDAWFAPPRPGVYLVRVPAAGDGGRRWTDAWLSPAPMNQVAAAEKTALDEVRLERIRGAAYDRRGTWLADFSYLHAPIAEKSNRPYYPHLFLCVDSSSQMILSVALAESSRFERTFRDHFCTAIEAAKTIPAAVHVRRDGARHLLEPIAARLGFDVKKVRQLRLLDEARRNLDQYISR